MPKDKDLKRLIRARMARTGESYAAARAQIRRTPKLPPDYETLAGMSDTTLLEKTGGAWPEWVRALDDAGASKWSHRDIAAWLAEHGVRDWWSQMLAVGYERIRGLRDVGQRRDGLYDANRSRTFGLPIEPLWDAFADDTLRARWLPPEMTLRNTNPGKTVRLDVPDGTIVTAHFTVKDPRKTTVTIQHRKLPDADSLADRKAFWGDRLDHLAEVVASD